MLIVKDLLHATSIYNTTTKTLGVARNRDGSDSFNAGFMYITPSNIEFTSMRQAALTMKYDASLQEQAFLNVYWKNRTVLMPAEVNQFVDGLTDRCVVMHFVSMLKPWFICHSYFTGHKKACSEWESY